MVIPTTINHN